MNQRNKENPIFGNITLPQIVKFIVEIVGKDSLLYFDFVGETELNDAYKEKGSYEKYKVNAQDYSFQFTYEHSIFGRIYQFFTKLETEFKLNSFYKDFFMDSCVTHLLVHIAGTRPFEAKQAEISKKNIFSQKVIKFDKFTSKQSFSCNPKFVDFVFLGSTSDFDALIRGYQEKSKTSFEDFYKKIAQISKIDEDSVRNAIQRCRKMNISPRWKIFYPLLQIVSESDDNDRMLTNMLLHQYFYKNFKEALCHLSVKKDLLVEFEQLSKKYSESAYQIFYDKHLDVEKTGLHDLKKWFAYFDSILEKNSIENVKKFQKDFDRLRSELPHSIVFFQNWFCAKDYVYRFMESGKLEKLSTALKWYKAAFDEGKYFAGKNLEKFLLEGIAVGFYFEWKSNPKQMRDRICKCSDISNHDTKTPIPASIKTLYDFAYAFDFVLNEKEDAYNYFYHCRDNFWNTFPPQTKNAEEIRGKDFVEEMGVQVFSGDIHEEIRKTLAKVTDKTVNTKLSTNHNVAYTPISYAILYCQWDFVQKFLDKSKFPSLDLNVPNTNNTYPIGELISKLREDSLPTEYDNIFHKILHRTDKRSFFTQSNHRKISALQAALETYQMKYIKPIVDKMTDTDAGKIKFPEEYRISADELSPLYYAIFLKQRIKTVLNKFPAQIKEPQNIIWKNLAVPGMTEEQKKAYWQNMNVLKEGVKEYYDNSNMDSENRNSRTHEKQIDEVISFLIERTENVDSFINYTGEYQKKQHFTTIFRNECVTLREKIPTESRQGVNALGFAAENDDFETCRKLIQAGADINRVLGFVQFTSSAETPNSFIFRCILFKSWRTLRMFLAEFKEKAEKVMHCGNFDITPLVAFIIVSKMEFQDPGTSDRKLINFSEIEEIIQLFLDCGASMTEPTKLGSAENLKKGY